MNDHYGREATLEEVLAARERRSTQLRDCAKWYERPTLMFTMNIPGPLKTSVPVECCFAEGYNELCRRLAVTNTTVLYQRIELLPTGPEGLLSVDMTAQKLKELTVSLETEHPQGRLFDVDVLDVNGQQVDRQSLGLAPRRCLLCGEDAKVCGRSRRHSPDELNAAVAALLEA